MMRPLKTRTYRIAWGLLTITDEYYAPSPPQPFYMPTQPHPRYLPTPTPTMQQPALPSPSEAMAWWNQHYQLCPYCQGTGCSVCEGAGAVRR